MGNLCFKLNKISGSPSQQQGLSLSKKRLAPYKLSPVKLKSCLTPTSKKRWKLKASRSVRFDDDAKTWDGPREAHILLENLVIDFWKPAPDVTIVDNLMDDANEQMLLDLLDTLLLAIERTQKSMRIEGAELIPGGGQYGVRLKLCNLADLNNLADYLRESCDIVKRRTEVLLV